MVISVGLAILYEVPPLSLRIIDVLCAREFHHGPNIDRVSIGKSRNN
jgi:hypothetical protein